jgi:hypothetical protein
MSPEERKHLYIIITKPPHPAGVTVSVYHDKPTGLIVRHKPVNSPASALKGRPTITPVKAQFKATASAPKRKRANRSISGPNPSSPAPRAKRHKSAAATPAVTPAAALLGRTEDTVVITFNTVAQVDWAKTMLSSYIDGLETTKNTLVARLEELFPQMTELDCERVTPLPEDAVLKAIVEGASTWESENAATMASWVRTDRADDESTAAINDLLGEITDLRYVIRGAQQAIRDGGDGLERSHLSWR